MLLSMYGNFGDGVKWGTWNELVFTSKLFKHIKIKPHNTDTVFGNFDGQGMNTPTCGWLSKLKFLRGFIVITTTFNFIH